MIRKLKNALRRNRLARAGVSVELELPVEVYGSGGGSWLLAPGALDAESVVYSFGVGRDISFDLELIEKHGARVHAFDPTPVSIAWLQQQDLPEGLEFHDYGIAAHDGEIEFFAPRKATSTHFTPVERYRGSQQEKVSAKVFSLSSIMRTLGHSHIDLMKMDIEGGEYEVIEEIVRERVPIGQLLIEFHHMYETIPLSKTLEAVEALRSIGMQVCAISERSYELSMVRQDYSSDRG